MARRVHGRDTKQGYYQKEDHSGEGPSTTEQHHDPNRPSVGRTVGYQRDLSFVMCYVLCVPNPLPCEARMDAFWSGLKRGDLVEFGRGLTYFSMSYCHLVFLCVFPHQGTHTLQPWQMKKGTLIYFYEQPSLVFIDTFICCHYQFSLSTMVPLLFARWARDSTG